MSLVAKIFTAAITLLVYTQCAGQDIYILTIGESIAANCNEFRYKARTGIYQINKAGNIITAFDPLEWADCDGGSIWMPLGEKIISKGLANKVIFLSIGMSGTKAVDWIKGGRAYPRLSNAIDLAKKNNISFDYALWTQGSTETRTEDYGRQVDNALSNISSTLTIKKWLIARHTDCRANHKDTEKIQHELGQGHLNKRFAGPPTKDLDKNHLNNDCHLNKYGQDKMADLWLDYLIKADSIASWIRGETLLDAFSFRGRTESRH